MAVRRDEGLIKVPVDLELAVASSWSAWYGPQPSASMAVMTSAMTSKRRINAMAS